MHATKVSYPPIFSLACQDWKLSLLDEPLLESYILGPPLVEPLSKSAARLELLFRSGPFFVNSPLVRSFSVEDLATDGVGSSAAVVPVPAPVVFVAVAVVFVVLSFENCGCSTMFGFPSGVSVPPPPLSFLSRLTSLLPLLFVSFRGCRFWLPLPLPPVGTESCDDVSAMDPTSDERVSVEARRLLLLVASRGGGALAAVGGAAVAVAAAESCFGLWSGVADGCGW